MAMLEEGLLNLHVLYGSLRDQDDSFIFHWNRESRLWMRYGKERTNRGSSNYTRRAKRP